MVVKFDKFDQYETPNLVLCYPSSRFNSELVSDVVSEIPFARDIEFVFNFNDISKLNFRVDLPHPTSEFYDASKRVFDLVVKGMYIYVDEVGFFRIDEANETLASFERYKDVSASSCETELANRRMPYIENGTYLISYILTSIIDVLPHWTLGSIDPALSTVYRTFEDVDVKGNVFDFMINDVQTSYGCVFVFDVKNRVIRTYARENYDTKTDIHLTREDVVAAISKRISNDTPYTAMAGYGDSENISINAANPIGTNVVYDFSYFLNMMPDDLAEKVSDWQDDVDSASSTYYSASEDYSAARQDVITIGAERDRIAGLISIYDRCKDNITDFQSTINVDLYNEKIDNPDEKILISTDVNATLSALQDLIDAATEELTDVDDQLALAISDAQGAKDIMDGIVGTLSFSSYFTSVEFSILSNYIYEGVYTDTNIGFTDNMTEQNKLALVKELYDGTKKKLLKVREPIYEFDIDTDSFVFISKFSYWTQQLKTGSVVNVDDGDGNILELYITSIVVNYEDRSSNFTFCTDMTGTGAKVLFDNLFDDVSKATTSITRD